MVADVSPGSWVPCFAYNALRVVSFSLEGFHNFKDFIKCDDQTFSTVGNIRSYHGPDCHIRALRSQQLLIHPYMPGLTVNITIRCHDGPGSFISRSSPAYIVHFQLAI